jgi:hypothetical protein
MNKKMNEKKEIKKGVVTKFIIGGAVASILSFLWNLHKKKKK